MEIVELKVHSLAFSLRFQEHLMAFISKWSHSVVMELGPLLIQLWNFSPVIIIIILIISGDCNLCVFKDGLACQMSISSLIDSSSKIN